MRRQSKNWESSTVTAVTCHTKRGETQIRRYAPLARAVRAVRAWATPLFRREDPTFTIHHVSGEVRWATPQEVGCLFDLVFRAPRQPAKIRTQAARPAPQVAIEVLPTKPLPVESFPTLGPIKHAEARADGKIPVRKQICHRGRTFAVTYWKTPERIAI
jgi:hypothetical protein